MDSTSNDPGTFPEEPHLSWWNVAVASGFLLINGAISVYMGLGLEKTILIAAVRCIIQLTIMGYVLTEIFSSKQPVIIMALATLLVLLATFELTFHRAKHRFTGSFLTIFGSLYLSTLLMSIIGGSLALETRPFYDPIVFIPTLGMLIGNGMSAIGVGLSYSLNQLLEHSELIEQRLAFGATRWEASRPVAIEAIKLALLPTINSMSVIGLITIPGMMTGQILGGTPIMDAVKYQQIIMFLITASSSLGTVISVLICLFTCVDKCHRIRLDLITSTQSKNHTVEEEGAVGVRTRRSTRSALGNRSRPASASTTATAVSGPTPTERSPLLGAPATQIQQPHREGI